MPELELKDPKTQGSAIKRAGLSGFLGRLFGFQRTKDKNIEFVKMDLGSDQRVGQALLNSAVTSAPLTEKLERLFQTWLSDNTDKLTELSARNQRISQLQYMYLNDPYANRTVALYADEACQLDSQDTLIRIETPDPRMTKDMYTLINQWGITQTRIRSTIEQLAIFGDAFWANKVSDKGVERILPLQQTQISDRIEFNPVKVLEMQKKRSGAMYTAMSKNYLLSSMFDSMTSSEDVTDLFDSKLFGFEIDQDTIVPPWSISHFRVGGEASDFWPWGTSPIIGALSPYKQTQSTITLQGLARMMSFPVTLYKVKTDENVDESRQFATVNRVREAYDNIGVTPAAGNSEVYTVNTKIWIPDGLLDVDVKKPETSSTDGIDDIKLYQDREAVSLGLPRSFFGEEGWFSANNSGKSLMQQYKPFARKVYSLQSAFLETLADLFRIHFAITGQYDFRIPFTLSLKYPVVEEDGDRINAKKDSLDMVDSIIGMIKTTVGLTDEDTLPPDIVRDIISKYSFLDPSDIMKWTRDASYDKTLKDVDEAGEDEDDDFGGSFGGSSRGREIGGDIGGGEDIGDVGAEIGGPETPEPATPAESTTSTSTTQEESRKKCSNRLREARAITAYKGIKESLYFESLKNYAVNNFVREGYHVQVFSTIPDTNSLMLETLSKNNGTTRLKEYSTTLYKKKNTTKKGKN